MPTVVSVAGKRVKLQCYDTAGQEQYRRSLTPVFVRNRDAYVLVYDVTDLQSLRSLRDNWVPMLANLVQPGATFLLVGNKLDLLHPAKPSTYAAAAAADASSTQASTTLVSLEEQELVEGIVHALQGELSAHVAEHVRLTSISGSGVQDAIQSVCRHIIRQKRCVCAELAAPAALRSHAFLPGTVTRRTRTGSQAWT